MSVRIRIAVKIVIFVVIFVTVSLVLTPIFTPKVTTGKNRTTVTIAGFYEEPKDSLDVIYFGASLVVHGVSPLQIWEEHGIASYSLATVAQMPRITLYLIEEAIAHQEPSVIVLDTSTLFLGENYDNHPERVRRVLGYTPMSARKLRLMSEIAAKSEQITFFSLLYPLDVYHDRWESLSADDFLSGVQALAFKGETPWYEVFVPDYDSNYMQVNNTGKAELSKIGAYCLERAIQLCRQNDIELMLTAMPRIDWSDEKNLLLADIAQQNGLHLVDYNLPEMREAIGLDFNSDYMDKRHLNTWGAFKVSKHLGAFLSEEFELADRRGDAAYAKWFEVLALYNQEKAAHERD